MRLLLLLSLFGCNPVTDSAGSGDDTGSAVAGCQRLSVDPTTLHWDNVEPGSPVTDVVTVTNTCTTAEDNLVFTASSSEVAFSVDLITEQTLAAGASATLVVTFLAPDTSSHFGALVFASNDPVAPQTFVTLEGLVSTDADGDGFANLGAGGDDCDDADASVHPGANEVWYDGADQDCDGADDYDQDGDGWPAVAYGGNDCADTNAEIHPGAPEVLDEIDEDCDGMVDEDFVLPGEIVVAEVMATPGGVDDAKGEWFEVANTGSGRIDLYGWQVQNSRGESFTVSRHTEIAGGGEVVLGSNGDAVSNGNVHVDLEYDSTTFSLNSSDGLTLLVDGRTIATVSWASASTGVARQLDPDHFDKTDAGDSDWWCDATSICSSGTDRGTPAAPNDQCTTVDEDGDGVTEAGGDCDDTDPAVNGDATDVWDGVDNDCDGFLDNPVVGDVASAKITGSGAAYLGASAGLGTGDVTGDGVDDLAIGSTFSSSYSGAAWVIDSADVIGAAAVVTSIDAATLNGETYSYFGVLPPTFSDYDSDGTADLVVAAAPYSAIYGGDAVDIFSGGSSLSGILDPSDSTTTIDDSDSYGYGAEKVLTQVDTDGDGVPEVVYANQMVTKGTKYYAGEVYLYEVNSTGTIANDDTMGTLSGVSTSGYVGASLSTGDLDGDGYSDVTVGAPGLTGAASSGGAVYVISGASFAGDQDIDDAAATVIYGSNRDDRIGGAMPVVADLDGSGGLDLAVSGATANAAYLFLGAAGLGSEVETADADTTLTGSNNFGASLYAADLDHDGRTDLAVGAPALSVTYASSTYYWFYAAGVDVGAVYIFDRDVMAAGGDHDSTEAFRGLTGDASGDLFGSVLAGGDFDDDGATDLTVAAPQAGAGGGGAAAVPGAVYVVLGN